MERKVMATEITLTTGIVLSRASQVSWVTDEMYFL